MNASGKSTLMKATGIAVILAQSGCYVPARSMRLVPFRAIFTRILNHDNIFQGLSSFAVEMSELRDILATADERSLILGDELCAGTESDSAQALVAAGIQWLAKKRAKFLFATHLHDIPKLIDTQSLGVSVWHIHVHYDAVTKKLIYDRQLREGSGSSLYGLEVARAMNLPYEFIQTALANRNRLVGEFRRTEATKTAWTEDLVKKTCELCGIAGAQRHLEVHHIQHRASAKNGRLATGEDMNHPRNLVVLCDKCHDKQHESQDMGLNSDTSDDSTPSQNQNQSQSQSQSRVKSVISSIQLTSDGPERQNIIVSVPPVQRIKISGKWSNEQILLIQQTLSKFPKASLKNIKFILQNNHAITISEASLRQFRTAKSE
jgi:DNA mismatch repair protein MutS